MVNTVSSNNSSTSSSATSASNKNTLGKDDFLKLMIAQMKNQDPMSPMDGTAYSAQLAQFSSLEQLTNLNNNVTQSMETNTTLTQSINNTMMATLIGKDVKLGGDELVLNGQDKINFSYSLPKSATSVSIKVYNSVGAHVKTITNAPTAAGENKLSWDLSDNTLANGNYTYSLEAVDANGKSISTTAYKEGTIDSVRFTSKGTVLVIDGAEYSLSSIAEVLNTKSGS
jgi:flagellar basal-body rod modification protein FlgD